MSWRRFLHGRIPGLLIGLTLLLTLCGLFAAGKLDGAELRALDGHFRWFGRVPASDDIVLVDITDEAIERSERWPWSRSVLAGIVRALHESDAKLIVLDLIFPEPQAPEYQIAKRRPYADLEGEVETLGTPDESNWIETDKLLAATMARAGNVVTGATYRGGPSRITSRLGQDVAARLRMEKSFGATARELAEALGAPLDEIERRLPGIKRRVAMELVEALVAERPEIAFRDVHARLLTSDFERLTADRADILKAYARARAVYNSLQKWPPIPPALRGVEAMDDHALIPPVYLFADQARRIGFVDFERGQAGGVVRSQRLMVQYRGRLVRQLAFDVACDALGIRAADLSTDAAGDLRIQPAADRPAMRVQLNPAGEMMIHWHVADDVRSSFEHIAVERFLEIVNIREMYRNNTQNIDFRRDRIAQSFVTEPQTARAYVEAVEQLREATDALRAAESNAAVPAESVEEQVARLRDLRSRLSGFLADSVELVTMAYESARDVEPRDAAEREQLHALRLAYQDTLEIRDLQHANETLTRELATKLDDLRQRIGGRICIVGHAATGLADLVVTPPFQYAPGSLVHANIINNFLQNTFLHQASRPTATLVIGLFGLAVVLVTLFTGPGRSLAFVLAAMAAYFWIHGEFVFGRSNLWVASATPIGGMFVCWAFVTLYRQLTEERTKRLVAKALGQYTSPEIARSIVEASVDFGPRDGVVTCFFADLASFTTISEQLGPERTRAILNPYLEAVSRVLIAHRAMINKFIGDAVFAFLNPPLLPCENHATAACAAALAARSALAELQSNDHPSPIREDLQRLAMRIGINTGPVFVGDYGSETKLDYTCIGDTVNLAARLEPANKVFGTSVMISESTYRASEGFEVRHLGALQVKGRRQIVQVYELLGHTGQVADEPLRYADEFGQAVAAFQRRDFPAAERGFIECRKARLEDPGAERYMQLLEIFRKNAPPDDWPGALELTEK